mmetsp:Transcript_637/g.862  ORF Transcript_637/g.862 Transcript_637/m.862 type:complete len:254 (+) Transcript_637:115-876(+)
MVNHAIAAGPVPIQILREPLTAKPVNGVIPAFSESNNGLVTQVLFGAFGTKPAIHHQHLHAERAQFHLGSHEEANGIAHVGQEVHEELRKMKFLQDGSKTQCNSKAIHFFPQQGIAAGIAHLVGMSVCVGANVKTSQRRTSLVQCALTEDESMTVVVNICKTDFVLSVAKNAKFTCGSCFHEIRQVKCVARAVDLVRCDGHCHQLVAGCFCDDHLPFCFGLRILLQVRLLWKLGQFQFRKPINIRAIEACGGR